MINLAFTAPSNWSQTQELVGFAALLLLAAICFGFMVALGYRNRKRGAFDASQALGSSQMAGVMVSQLGRAKGRAGAMGAGGVGEDLGGIGDRVLRGPKMTASPTTPRFGAHGLLAVTASEIALIKLGPGLTSPKQDEVLARLPRSEAASAELGQGLNAPMTITFGDGATWQFEVGWNVRKDAEAVISALGVSAAEM
jgi:hypothetical protein